MRVPLLLLALIAGCDVGTVKIQDDVDTDAPEGSAPDTDDTSPPDTDALPDTDVAPDTDVPTDTDPGTSTGTVFDAPSLAWDGSTRWTFTQWWGGTCSHTVVESGEEIGPGDASWAQVSAQCQACTRFFEVRQTRTGGPCIQDVPATEWRGVEVRPTGRVNLSMIVNDPVLGWRTRDALANLPLSGADLPIAYTTFAPVYAKTVVRGKATLTPVP